jgi:hypothetical protein
MDNMYIPDECGGKISPETVKPRIYRAVMVKPGGFNGK